MAGVSLDSRRTLARLVADHRERQGLTQTELAARAGLQANAISQLELGKGNPTWATLQRVATALGYADPVEMIVAAEPPVRYERELVREFRRLPDDAARKDVLFGVWEQNAARRE
jgi:transcriptional regulator with XRE-family HTH domain